MKKLKEQKGITLVALVITIILLLLLAGITISLVLGDNGILNRSKNSAQTYQKEAAREKLVLKIADLQIEMQQNENREATLKDLKGLENKDKEITKIELNDEEYPSQARVTIDGYIFIVDDKLNIIGEEIEDKPIIAKINNPVLVSGMTPIKWNGKEWITVDKQDSSWYAYQAQKENEDKQSKWANVKMQDGSMFVWIPRYAYKIIYDNPNNKAQGGKIAIIFIQGTGTKDFQGREIPEDYIIHPAFRNGESTEYANGEWDQEVEGIWIAKFKAGNPGQVDNPSSAIDSTVAYTTIMSHFTDSAGDRNYPYSYYGDKIVGMKIKYPIFTGNTPTMNYLTIGEAYGLAQSLEAEGNPYGLAQDADSHMLKNSEWGAIAYLTHSRYGRNGNAVESKSDYVTGTYTRYFLTGQGDYIKKIEQSSTGNVYGIYDLNNSGYEYAAGYIAVGSNYINFGGDFQIGKSTKYKTLYAGTSTSPTANYAIQENTKKIGEAIWETSTSSDNNSSWIGGSSDFLLNPHTFIIRSINSIFSFSRYRGMGGEDFGFRIAIIGK